MSLPASGDVAEKLPFRSGSRLMFAASTGGHLAQLWRFSKLIEAADDSLWVTFENEQSRSLLTDANVEFVPYIPPRGLRQALAARSLFTNFHERHQVDGVVSTGAAIAVPALLCRPARRLPRAYIESVARFEGPSMTGRILAATRSPIRLYTQHPEWADHRWASIPSVLRTYGRTAADGDPVSSPNVFVTLGTIKPYRFDRLVDAVLATGLANSQTVWQLGETSRSDLPGTSRTYMSNEEFVNACSDADVVVTHAGMGTILHALEHQVPIIVVPRESSHGEHVDDHQGQIATVLERGAVATVRRAGDLTAHDVRVAASSRLVIN